MNARFSPLPWVVNTQHSIVQKLAYFSNVSRSFNFDKNIDNCSLYSAVYASNGALTIVHPVEGALKKEAFVRTTWLWWWKLRLHPTVKNNIGRKDTTRYKILYVSRMVSSKCTSRAGTVHTIFHPFIAVPLPLHVSGHSSNIRSSFKFRTRKKNNFKFINFVTPHQRSRCELDQKKKIITQLSPYKG